MRSDLARQQPTVDDVERRTPRPATRSLAEILACFDQDRASHMCGEPATERDLRQVERALGAALPPSLRTFLARFGGGLFYHGHEIFGPYRVMIHDIELVPDLLSMRRRVEAELTQAAGLVPFHRARGVVHFMDLRSGSDAVSALPWSTPYPDLPSFLETVVLPRAPE